MIEAGCSPFSPVPVAWIRPPSFMNDSWNELQWSRSRERRIFSAHLVARFPQAPEQTASFQACR